MARPLLPLAMAVTMLVSGGTMPAATTPAKGEGSLVSQGTRFLVKLEGKLHSGKHDVGKKFSTRTLEPLVAADGTVLPPGAEIRGHISRVEPAGATGRARIWLTFDEIRTRGAKLPVIARVASVPGEHGVREAESREGEIEARTSHGAREAEAAAIGAVLGAAAGAHKGGKGAAVGAAAGAVAGFLIASGFGRELELPKGTKLELQLERPLYLGN
jgi:hypothetical protein